MALRLISGLIYNPIPVRGFTQHTFRIIAYHNPPKSDSWVMFFSS